MNALSPKAQDTLTNISLTPLKTSRVGLGKPLRISFLSERRFSNINDDLPLNSAEDRVSNNSPLPISPLKKSRSGMGAPMRISSSGTPMKVNSNRNSFESVISLDDKTKPNDPESLFVFEKPQPLSKRSSRGSAGSVNSFSSEDKVDSNINNTAVEKKIWTLEEFTLSKPLGKGKFGNVYLGIQKSSKVQVALKVLFKSQLISNNNIHSLKREIEIQSRLIHPHIVKLYGYFHDIKNCYIILEYVTGGELYKYIQKLGGSVPEGLARTYIISIASAIHYLHSLYVIHRDIKPENIVVSADGKVVKLTDFGWAVHAPPIPVMGTNDSITNNTNTAAINKRYTMCGTPEYLSPEIIHGSGHGKEVDYWSLGIFMFELITGTTPFRDGGTCSNAHTAINTTTNTTSVKGVKAGADISEGSEEESDRTMRIYQNILGHTAASAEDTHSFKQYPGISSLTPAYLATIHACLHPDPVCRCTASQILTRLS